MGTTNAKQVMPWEIMLQAVWIWLFKYIDNGVRFGYGTAKKFELYGCSLLHKPKQLLTLGVGGRNHMVLHTWVRLYDIAAQRRPVRTIDFRESPIKVVTEDPDGFTVYVGNGTGDLASFDMRTGKMIGSFVGKCCGSIKSIARHPELPVLASCGLDRYLRLWDVKTRQLLEAVFLKQVLTNVVFDASSVRQGVSSPKPNEELATNQTEVKDTNGSKRSSATLNSLEHDEKGSKKAKLKKKKRVENAT